MYRRANDWKKAHSADRPDANRQQYLARVDRVRKAIRTLILDLPELVTAIRFFPSGEEPLADLLAASSRASRSCPDLAGHLRVIRRPWWKWSADCIAGAVLVHWRQANPGRIIGRPLSEEQPATKVMTQLLTLAGYDDVTPERVAKHFARDQSALAIINA
jgi:hypothetical protein